VIDQLKLSRQPAAKSGILVSHKFKFRRRDGNAHFE
jgi:hypothetical protein